MDARPTRDHEHRLELGIWTTLDGTKVAWFKDPDGPTVAFEVFTQEIDRWWRRGLKYRVAGKRRGIIRLEPGVGGRLFESFETDDGTRVVETGRACANTPPRAPSSAPLRLQRNRNELNDDRGSRLVDHVRPADLDGARSFVRRRLSA